MNESNAQSIDEVIAHQQPTLISSIRRYWWIVLLTVAIFVGLGIVLGVLGGGEYAATADVIIEDPRARVLFPITESGGTTNQASERYLADQVEILRSTDVALAASESLGGDFSPEEVVLATTVTGELTSNLIEVTFRAETPEDAKRGADAVVEAYIELQRDRIQRTANTAIEALETLIADSGTRLDEIESRIEILVGASEERQELERQLAAAEAELNAARMERDAATPGTVERELLNTRIDELLRDFAAWETILRIETPDAKLTALVVEQDGVVAEQTVLIARRNSLTVDARTATGGVVLYSPASIPLEPTGIPIEFIVAGAAALGFALATAIAYGLSLRRTTLTDRNQPELLLDAPIIGDIPSLPQGRGGLALPIVEQPDSPGAEAFRFIANAISGQQERAIAAGNEPARIIAVAPAIAGDGRTVVTGNTAIAFAQEGYRVLVLDADFEHQRAASLLAPRRNLVAGLNEVVEVGLDPTEAVVRIDEIDGRDIHLFGRGTVDLLARGGTGSSAPFLFKQPGLTVMLEDLARKYDLVLIDSPPLLEVAYAGSVINLADAALAVVPHGQNLRTVQEFREQLDLVNVPVVGYVYDRSNVSLDGARTATT